jgi:hypothetical protein
MKLTPTEMHKMIEQHRRLAAQTPDVLVPSETLITLLDYIRELEHSLEEERWTAMGENL